MKKLSKETYEQIRSWVYLHARQLDIARWQYFFENGSKEAVVEALSRYQNEDGGFGHGLEPDNANPHSSPATTHMAYGILKGIGCAEKEHPMMQGIINYIANCAYFTDHGWYWSIPSNNHYPCQPWYYFPNAPWFPPDWPPENFCNGANFALALKYLDKNHAVTIKTLQVIEYRLPLMKKFGEFCSFAKSKFEQAIEAEDWMVLIGLLREYGLRSAAECDHLLAEFMEIVRASANAGVYEQIRKKAEHKEEDADELDLLVDKLSHGNVWNTDGLYSDNPDEKKDQVCFVSALWWPILWVIDDLKKLREYDRI